MKKVLVLDGGGAKGIMQNKIITEIEKGVSKKVAEIFDLIVGTSVGAINGAMHASGKITSETDAHVFDTVVKKVFGKKHLVPPLYTADPIKDGFDTYLGANFTMGKCATKFMCTSVSAVDKMTHYFRSWGESCDALIYDIVRRSFAAPFFFGQVIDEKNQQVWLDGGVGIANCPLLPALEEIQKLGWVTDKESVLLINIGTGYALETVPFEKAKKYDFIRQIGEFMDPLDGGLARYQALTYQRMILDCNLDCNTGIYGVVVDTVIPESLDKMDNIDAMDTYLKLGQELYENTVASNEKVMGILKSN